MSGWIKLHRSINDSAVASHPEYLAVWVHLLLRAQHKPCECIIGRQVVNLLCGQFVFGRIKFSAEIGVSENKVRAALDVMKSLNMITIKSMAKFSIISIVKWKEYQAESPANNHETASTSPAPSQQAATYKNVKNVNNDKKKEPSGKPLVTFSCWMESLKFLKESPIPEDHPIFNYAADAGIPEDYLRLCWVEFRDKYSVDSKRYKDWRSVFGKVVRENWFKLWWLDNNEYKLTSKGQQAMIAMNNRDKREEK